MHYLRLSTIYRSGKRTAFVVPFFFTFANAFLGLCAVLYAIEGSFLLSAYCIMMAALVDAFDGRLARALGSTSQIGMELDSLCDAISFCFAPALVLYRFQLDQAGFLGFAVAGLYLCCGLFRLARFNNIGGCPGGFFMGLPTTIAALVCAALILHVSYVMPGVTAWYYEPIVLVGIVAVLAYLMISRLRFPSFKQSVRACRFSQAVFAIIVMSVACAWYFQLPLPLTVMTAYVVGSVVCNGVRSARRCL